MPPAFSGTSTASRSVILCGQPRPSVACPGLTCGSDRAKRRSSPRVSSTPLRNTAADSRSFWAIAMSTVASWPDGSDAADPTGAPQTSGPEAAPTNSVTRWASSAHRRDSTVVSAAVAASTATASSPSAGAPCSATGRTRSARGPPEACSCRSLVSASRAVSSGGAGAAEEAIACESTGAQSTPRSASRSGSRRASGCRT